MANKLIVISLPEEDYADVIEGRGEEAFKDTIRNGVILPRIMELRNRKAQEAVPPVVTPDTETWSIEVTSEGEAPSSNES